MLPPNADDGAVVVVVAVVDNDISDVSVPKLAIISDIFAHSSCSSNAYGFGDVLVSTFTLLSIDFTGLLTSSPTPIDELNDFNLVFGVCAVLLLLNRSGTVLNGIADDFNMPNVDFCVSNVLGRSGLD